MICRRLVALAAVVAAFFALCPTVASAKWLRAETAHFVVYSDRAEKAVRDYAVTLEAFDGLLRLMHGRPAGEAVPRKLDVYLVGGIAQLRRMSPGLSENVGGFYYASAEDIFAAAIRGGMGAMADSTRGDDVVFHEYVHHFMRQYFEAAHPPWLSEGYAEYYASTDVGPKAFTVGNVHIGRAIALAEPGGQLDISLVLTKKVSEIERDSRGAFYAQAWLLTHYVMSDADRRRKLSVYLEAWRRNGDSLKAWEAAYGQDAKALQRALENYGQGRKLAGLSITRLEASPPAVTITTLPDGAAEVLLELQQLKIGSPKEQREDLQERLRSVHARMPNDRLARLAYARFQTQYGDRASGEAILRQMIAQDAGDWEAMLALAASRIAAGRASSNPGRPEAAEASRILGQVSKLRPDDYRIYILYSQARSGLAGEPSENTLNILDKAVRLAPQVDSARLAAARAFIHAKLPDEARYFLEPLANNPHGGGSASAAQSLLATLDGQAPPPGADDQRGGEDED